MKSRSIPQYFVVLTALTATVLGFVALSVFSAMPANAGHNADGLAGYWPFEEGAGATALDLSTHSNDGAIVGAAYDADAAPIPSNSYSLDFDGVDDVVTVADDDELSFGDGATDSPFSVSAWVKMDATDFTILSKFNGSPNNEYAFAITGDGRLVFVLYDETGPNHIGLASPVSSEDAQVGAWTHYAATYDGSASSDAGSIRLYRNGVEIATTSIDAGSYTAMHNTATDLEIGRTFGGVVDRKADGHIDDARIYSTELSPDEVAALADYGEFTVETEDESVAYNPVGSDHTVNVSIEPALGHIPVLFEIDGPNSAESTTVFTDDNGDASLTYTSDGTAGTDDISVCIDLDDSGTCDAEESTVELTKHWYNSAVYGGGHILEEEGKRKDWMDISFGGETFDLGADGLMGSWQVNFHNVENSIVDKSKFHGNDIVSLNLFDGGAGNCDAAMNLKVNGRFNGQDGWSMIIRAGDNEDTMRFELYNPGGGLAYDSNATNFTPEGICVGSSRTPLDTGNITIEN